MTTTEQEAMKHPCFRLKIDLSKFFDDARRFCWIFVNGMKIQRIIHMKQHISKLFNIIEPFHLLLNDTEYLPPVEDVRILKENETILVIPGSGINKAVPAIVETRNSSMCDKHVQTINIPTSIVVQDTSNDTLNNTQSIPINNTTRDMTFYSIISDTVVNHSREDTVVNHNSEDTDSKTTNNHLTEDCNRLIDSIVSVVKRKRVRKRKPRNQSLIVSPDITEKNIPKLKKPKIIDSYIISSEKHIRFDNIQNDENKIANQIVQEVPTNESYLNKTSRNLSTLLKLRQSLTPITFGNKKLINEVKTDSILNDKVRNKNLNKTTDYSIEKKLYNEDPKKEIQSYKNLHIELEKIPIMTKKPQINDIIAFKTLKIDTDYTPQISNFICTKVLGSCTQSGNYTLQILYGKEEIQVSFGKFSVSEDESENYFDEDTFVLNYSQMMELRLIS